MNAACRALLGAVIILCAAAPARSQPEQSQPEALDGDRIAEIAIEGLRRVGREAALSGVTLKQGDSLTGDAATELLRALWKTEFFRDVRIERERAGDGGWRVIAVVREKPSIHDVRFEGNDDISEEDIKGVVDVKSYTILNVDDIKRNVEKIKNLCVEKGFYLADVDYRLEPVGDANIEVNVVFHIVENAKVIVRQISFVGNTFFADDELKAVMQTREGNEFSWLTDAGTYKEEFFQTDLFRIQALYYDHGFVSVKLADPSATISQDRRFIYITIAVSEGEQYDIGDITFAGDVLLKDEQGKVLVDESTLQSKLTVASGNIFNRTKLFADIQMLTDVYRDQGYAYANVTPNSTIHRETRRVDLQLEVERGEVVYFERIEVVGNTRTRDRVVRRELRINEGEKYSAAGINLSRARVFQLGYFETVNIATSRGSAPNLMDVQVEIKEKSTGTFQVGVGFSSVESFIATAQVSQNNFLGSGQLLSVSMQLSFGNFARQLATLQFYEPYFLNSRWSFGFNAYITQRLFSSFQRNAKGFSPSFGYPITHALRVNAGYTIQAVKISTGNLGGGGGVALDDLKVDGIQSSVNGSVSYDTRDNRLFPSSGHYHVVRGEVSDRALGSKAGLSFKRLEFDLRYYYPLFLSFVLRMNASLGWIFPVGNGEVPISERFFPGGIYSVRGFNPRGLGPIERVTLGGDPMSSTVAFTRGGDKQAVFNLELQFPIVQQAGIKGVLFADAGNAYGPDEGFFYYNTRDPPVGYMIRSGDAVKLPLGLYYSFGFGFRWFSPIGPLRFEWGIPITKRSQSDRDLIFEFTIGNFF